MLDMPSTHTSLWYHIVFSTKNRVPQIAEEWRPRLHEYIGGCIRGLGGVPIEIGGVADHVHALVILKPAHAPADIVREVKKASTSWVHQSLDSKFAWQDGYGAFTVGRSERDAVQAYVRGQEKHHRRVSFQDEYVRLLADLGIEYDPRYLW